MLEHKKIIILSRRQILVLDKKQSSITLPSQKTEKTYQKMAQALKQIVGSQSLDILLADDSAYCFALQIAEKPSQETLAELLQKKIPENVSSENFTWKIISKHDDGYLVQVLVPTGETLGLTKALSEAKIKINFLQSLSYALAQTLSKNKNSYIVFDQRENLNTLLLCHQGAVLFASLVQTENLTTAINSLLRILKSFKLEKLAALPISADKTPSELSAYKNKIALQKVELELTNSPALKEKNNLQLFLDAKNQTTATENITRYILLLGLLALASLPLVVMLFLKYAN